MPCVPSCWAGCLWKDRGTPARMSLGQVGGWVGIGPLQSHRRNDFPQPTCILAPLCEVLLELAFVLRWGDASLLINNASKVVCTALCHQGVLVEVCGVWNWTVFQTVGLIKLLIQDSCQLRQGVEIILLESDYSSTTNSLKKMWCWDSRNSDRISGISLILCSTQSSKWILEWRLECPWPHWGSHVFYAHAYRDYM